MMFLAPGYLAVAGGIAALVTALHFIVTREPATVPLPTARFAPDRPVRARARTLRFSDLLLLLCRTGLVLLAGAAMARPVLTPGRRPLARIVVADRSGAVADPAEVRGAVGGLLSPGDALILFDSTARPAPAGAESLTGPGLPASTGSLSAALIAAIRAAVGLRDAADSLEMVVVSAFTTEEMDQATDSIRALWPGALRLIRVAARADSTVAPQLGFEGAVDDPLRYALPPARTPSNPDVRIVRGTAAAADSAWAAAGDRALVIWPADPATPASDTIGAVSAAGVVVVAPFGRDAAMRADAGRVVARWLDGAPAATESVLGAGCIRSVRIPVPSDGDLVLDPRFQRLAARLTGRCGVRVGSTPLDTVRLADFAGRGRPGRVGAESVGRLREIPTPLVPWLLAAALLLGLGDLFLRRRGRQPVLS